MDKEVKEKVKHKHYGSSGGGCAVYGIGLIGAIVYYFQNSVTFNDYLTGLLKAFAWPAFLVHKALTLLGM